VMGALQYWSPVLCATSDAAVVAATAALIDVATPGGAAIGTETAALVEAVTSDLLTSHRYRANVVAVLLWPAHVLGGWARSVAAGGGHEYAAALALDERRVAAHLSLLALGVADAPRDHDPQARGMRYQFIATCTPVPEQVLPSLITAAEGETHRLARASAVESIFIAAARLAPVRVPEVERWLATAVEHRGSDVRRRLKHGLDWLGWMGLRDDAQAVLNRLALDSRVDDEQELLWPVESI